MFPLKFYVEYDGSILRSQRGRCFKNAMIVCGYLRKKSPTKKSKASSSSSVEVPLRIIATIADYYGRKIHPVVNETVYITKPLVYVQGIELPWFIRSSEKQKIPLKLFFLGLESIRKFILYELGYPQSVLQILEYYILKHHPRILWFISDRELLMETDKGMELFRLDYFDDMMMFKPGFNQFLEFWKSNAE